MKYTLFFILFLFTFSVHAQNIVPNYSFEEKDSCPTNLNGSFYKYSLGCVSWGEAAGSVDYFNACDTSATSLGSVNPIVGVPDNIWGHQTAFEGFAYTGIVTYDSELTSYREYLIDSIPALEMDTPYLVSIEVSLADSSRFATDGLGVLFTTYGVPYCPSLGTIPNTPQVDYTSYGIITDTMNWTKLSGIFIPDSAYTTLTIGGFKNASNMHILGFNGNAHKLEPYNSYYYIDNVVVEKLSATASIASISKDNDVNIYPNPMTDHSTLLFNNRNHQNTILSIFNAQGQIVQQINDIHSDRIIIERNGLPSGFYYYQLRNPNKIITTGKLIIQ